MPVGRSGKQAAVGHLCTRMGQQQPAGKTQGAARPAAEKVLEATGSRGSPAVLLTSAGGRQRMDTGEQQLQSSFTALKCTGSGPGMGPWQ